MQIAASKSGNAGSLEVLASTFGVEASDRPAIYRGLASMHGLVAESRETIAKHSDLRQDLYQGTLSNIESILTSINLGGPWDSYRTALLGANLLGLQFVADQLDRLSDELEVSREELESLRAMLDETVSSISSAEIDLELKRILVEKLEAARRAILDYQFGGIDGIRRATESAVGAVVLAGPAAKSESARESVGQYLDLMSKAVDLVNKARPMLAFLRPMVRFFIGGGDEPPLEQ